jgi:aminoglycoside phosphotransferase (APT) family kinase protein
MHDVRRALAAELRSWLGHEAEIRSWRRLGDGVASDCFGFELAAAPADVPSRLVLRLMREDQAAARECAIQTAVERLGLPVAHILRTGSSASAFGRPFSIMAFVAGRDPVADGMVRRVPQILADTLRRIHALPTEGMPAVGDVNGLVKELRASARAEIAQAARWFEDGAFERSSFVLCHGDLHARNLLVEDGQLVAVLDWEIARLAPRAFDVARSALLLRLMPGVGGRLLRQLVRLLGRRASRQFVDAYATPAPLDSASLARCEALHVLRLVALIRSPGLATAGVRALWRPFERTLATDWTRLTGTSL